MTNKIVLQDGRTGALETSGEMFEKTVELPKINPATLRLSAPRKNDLIAPERHQDRMEWIRSSFQTCFRYIEDREKLMELSKGE